MEIMNEWIEEYKKDQWMWWIKWINECGEWKATNGNSE